jgi:hypothetical protein
MHSAIPSSDEVRTALQPLSRLQLKALGLASGISWHTLYKIKRGEIRQPNVDIVRDLMPCVAAMQAATQGNVQSAADEVRDGHDHSFRVDGAGRAVNQSVGELV